MNRQKLLSDYLSEKKETLMHLSKRSGVHYVTLSKIKNGADCRMSTWDAICRCICDQPQQQASGE